MFLYATIYVLMSVANAAPQDYELAQYPTADKLLDSLLHLMEFFSSRYKQINLDGIFGIRITQSEFLAFIIKFHVLVTLGFWLMSAFLYSLGLSYFTWDLCDSPSVHVLAA